AEHAMAGHVAWVGSLAESDALSPRVRGLLCARFLAALDEALGYMSAGLPLRLTIATVCHRALARLAEAEPNELQWMNGLGIALNKIGELRGALGDGAGAERAAGEALSHIRSFLQLRPGHPEASRKLSIALEGY